MVNDKRRIPLTAGSRGSHTAVISGAVRQGVWQGCGRWRSLWSSRQFRARVLAGSA